MSSFITPEQWEAGQLAELPEWARERIAQLEAEITRLRREGVPGVMHEIDKAFHKLAIQERDYARTQVANRDAEIGRLQARAEALDAYARQNEGLHRDNLLLRDANAALRDENALLKAGDRR